MALIPIGGSGEGAIVVDDNHIFPGANKAACETDRDAYFVANPSELVEGLQVVLQPADTGTPILQERRASSWVDITAIIQGPAGVDGGGAVSNETYGPTWASQTTTAASKKSIYDKIDAMDTAIAGNTAKRTYPAGDETKVGFISVTQAVDLDQIETDVTANNAKVSADGSVTTHNDVTDAGSGAIITDAERTKLTGIEAGAEVNPTNAEVKTAYEANADTNAFTDAEKTKLGELDTATKAIANRMASTAVLDGIEVSGTVGGTTFNLSAGVAVIVDSTTNALNPTVTTVSYAGATGLTVNNIATQPLTYVGINASGSIVQQNVLFSPAQQRDIATVAVLIHPQPGNVIIDFQEGRTPTPDQLANQVSDLSRAIGPINRSGNVFVGNPAGNLQIDKGAGSGFFNALNRKNDPKNPNFVTMAALSAISFTYTWQDGSGGFNTAPATALNPLAYDDGTGGVAQPNGVVNGNNWSVHRVFVTADNIVAVQYGQEEYGTLIQARQRLLTEDFTVNPQLEGALFRGYIIARGGGTDLTNSGHAEFLQASNFGGVSGGPIGSGAIDLQASYDLSTIPQIITSIAGAFTIREGNADDTNKIYQGQNSAGATTFSIDGNGDVSLNALTVSANINGGTNEAVNFADPTTAQALTTKNYVDTLVNAAIRLQGDWNANTNTPDITATTTTGFAWRVSVAGTTSLGGISSWAVGDLAVKTDSGWLRIANQDIAAVWGNISGTLSNQTDLQNALNSKANLAGADFTGAISVSKGASGSQALFGKNIQDDVWITIGSADASDESGIVYWDESATVVGMAVGGTAVGGGLNVDTDGNVGIGTTTPSYKLDTLVGAGTQTIFRAGQIGVSNGFTVDSDGSSLTYKMLHGQLNVDPRTTASTDVMTFGGAISVESFYTAASTNFGLNIDTANTQKLVIKNEQGTNRQAYIFSDAAGAENTVFGVVTSSDGGTNYSPAISANQAGTVGIGTATPASDGYTGLETTKNIRIATGAIGADPTLYFDHDNFSSNTNNFIRLHRTTESMTFGTAGNERLRIDSSGNVGIGTTNPSSKLHVDGTVTALGATLTNVPTYANDAAAGVGGLVSGDVYKQSDGAGGFNLKIKA